VHIGTPYKEKKMSINIEIKEGNVVEIFDTTAEHGLPFLRQPNWPNGAAWADADEARSWAEMYVEAMEVADAPFAPNGPGMERQPKPTAEQIAAMETLRNPQSTEEERTAAQAILEAGR
jgi:hypothetical protein